MFDISAREIDILNAIEDHEERALALAVAYKTRVEDALTVAVYARRARNEDSEGLSESLVYESLVKSAYQRELLKRRKVLADARAGQ